MKDVYLNHAGTSWPKPDAVVTAMHEAAQAPPNTWLQRFEAAHRKIADFFSVDDPADILLTPGCTSSLAVGIGDVFVPAGKRILTSRWEHHALHRPLLKLAAQGVSLEYIPCVSGHAGAVDLEQLESSLAVGDVGLVALTAACNVTGELLPFEEVIALARKHDAMVLLDAAQLVGWIDLDLPNLGADLVAFGGHKGLQGPWGIGCLYVSENARLQCLSANCALPSQFEKTSSPKPSYCDVGSVDQIALAGLQAALEVLQGRDTTGQLAVARAQISRIESVLRGVGHVRIYPSTKENGIKQSGELERPSSLPTVAFELEGVPSTTVAAKFAKLGITIGSGLHCSPLAHETLGTSMHGLCRISLGIGQPDADIDAVIENLPKLICEGC